ncbi:MAG TPA: type VI secretion system baseplate subunit TssE [Pyrinomonadaceae bacterium]|jgi:type VI secretion system protein ImpF|nr:type VI secretion system baseplate subunit TssE [Pyrinomonadaceae bacterium]
MPRIGNEIRVIPSVLDRLLDYEPELSSEPLSSRANGLRQMKQSVRRDLEWLLNARQSSSILAGGEHPDGAASIARELQNSLIFYGLPDFSSANTLSVPDQKRISRAIEVAVARFEPRLSDVVVTLLPMAQIERALRFRIDARMRVEPAPEPVTFDTVLHIHSGEYRIEAD